MMPRPDPHQPPRPLTSYYIPCIFGGLFLGLVAMGAQGFVLGGVIGYLLAANVSLQQRLARLEEILTSTPMSPSAEPAGRARGATPPAAEPPPVPEVAPLIASRTSAAPMPGPSAGTTARRPPPPAAEPAPLPPAKSVSGGRDDGFGAADRLLAAVKKFFTTGNIILKIGLIILFCGVSFLHGAWRRRETSPTPTTHPVEKMAAVGGIGQRGRGDRRHGRYPLSADEGGGARAAVSHHHGRGIFVVTRLPRETSLVTAMAP